MSFSKLLLYSMCLVYGCIDYKTCTAHLSCFFFLKKRQPYETCRNCEIKKKGSNRKCVGYSNVSGMYGLCKTYAWASEFPDLLSWSLSRRGWGGGSQLVLLLCKSFLLHSYPAVQNLQKSLLRHEFLWFFPHWFF